MAKNNSSPAGRPSVLNPAAVATFHLATAPPPSQLQARHRAKKDEKTKLRFVLSETAEPGSPRPKGDRFASFALSHGPNAPFPSLKRPFVTTNGNPSFQTSSALSLNLSAYLDAEGRCREGEKKEKKEEDSSLPEHCYPIHIPSIFIIHHLRFLTSATDCADGLAGISHSWERR